MGAAYIIVGTTGTGKTTFVKERLKKVKLNALYLYDVNREYTEFKNEPLPKFDNFLLKATSLKNAVMVFEEATIFFGNKSSSHEMTELLVRKRHTNNTIFLVFHSLRAIPRNIMELVNGVFLFYTVDSSSLVDQKFKNDKLNDVFEEVQKEYGENKYYYGFLKTN